MQQFPLISQHPGSRVRVGSLSSCTSCKTVKFSVQLVSFAKSPNIHIFHISIFDNLTTTATTTLAYILRLRGNGASVLLLLARPLLRQATLGRRRAQSFISGLSAKRVICHVLLLLSLYYAELSPESDRESVYAGQQYPRTTKVGAVPGSIYLVG